MLLVGDGAARLNTGTTMELQRRSSSLSCLDDVIGPSATVCVAAGGSSPDLAQHLIIDALGDLVNLKISQGIALHHSIVLDVAD